MIEDTQPTLPQPTEPPQELVNASVSPTEPVSPIPTPESSTESTPEPQAEEINEQGTMSKPQEAIENIQPTEPQEQPPQPPEPQPSAFQPAPTEQASQIEKPPEDTPRPVVSREDLLPGVANGGSHSSEAVTTPQTAPTEPTNQETQEQIIEKTIVRELTEDEKSALYKTRLKTFSIKGNQARTDKRKAAYEKILAYIREHGFASNNEIQKHCEIGDSTATRYLRELEKQGLILKIGRTKNTRWRLVQGIP